MVHFNIPQRFRDRYEPLVDDKEAFFASLARPLSKAFRVNTLKADVDKVLERLQGYGIEATNVAWDAAAFVTPSDKTGATLEHFMGHIYIQELVSMLPPLMLKEEIKANPEMTVLDACAAPGSKTTQLSALMRNRGLIVANDAAFNRLKIIKHNLEKLGCMNVAVVNHDARFFKTDMQFDCILLDAPCSSEGTIRKNREVLSRWNEKEIISTSGLQKHMITRCYEMLRPGGLMVYSTCTFAPEENEGVVDYLLSKSDCKLERIEIKGLNLSGTVKEWSGRTFASGVANAARVWPHHNDTGGFFMAKIRKPKEGML
jgi:NOL1/NOP2/sun family putative RNA methylase